MEKVIESPFSNGKAHLTSEKRQLTFRKEIYEFSFICYVCEDTNEKFTTNELDELNLLQVHNQYRIMHGIPFADEIKDIRLQYGLSALKMSKILGLGDNQYRLYENGEMPSESNGKMIKSIADPNVFKGYVIGSENILDHKEFEKILKQADSVNESVINTSIYQDCKRSQYNGYAPQCYEKLKNAVLFFLNQCGSVCVTKMNKLLFYTDFLNYKNTGYGLTGLTYMAIQYGPAPVKWNLVYGNMDNISTDINDLEQEILSTSITADLNCFSELEIQTLTVVANTLKNKRAKELSELSHQEDAWLNAKGSLINYSDAFTLKAL